MQDLGASPNVMSELPAGQIDEVRMYPLHLAVQAKNNACVSLLINHKSVSALLRLDFERVVRIRHLYVISRSLYAGSS
jgi:hypothetical protein